MQDERKAILLNEVRYAERLCARTARFYRRVQAVGTFGAVLGGSGTLGSLSSAVPAWVSVGGAALLACFGALLVAMRPADKAAANEADVRRYAKVRTEGLRQTADELQAALDRARESDVPEIEALRQVAYNDMVREVGRPDCAAPLNRRQRLMALLA